MIHCCILHRFIITRKQRSFLWEGERCCKWRPKKLLHSTRWGFTWSGSPDPLVKSWGTWPGFTWLWNHLLGESVSPPTPGGSRHSPGDQRQVPSAGCAEGAQGEALQKLYTTEVQLFLDSHFIWPPHLIFRVNDMRFPANLEAFFASKEGLKIQSQESAPPDPKATAEKGSDEKEALKPGIASASVSPDEGVSPPRSASPCTSCPLCSKSFPLEVMVHKLYVKKSNMLVTIKNPGAWRARSKMLWRWGREDHCQLSHLWPGAAGEGVRPNQVPWIQCLPPPGGGAGAACSYLCSSNFWQLIVFAFHTIQIFTCDILSISYVLYLTMLWKCTVLAQRKETFPFSWDLKSLIYITFKLSPAVFTMSS